MHFTLLTHVMKVLWKTSVELALEFGNYTSKWKWKKEGKGQGWT